MDGRDTIGAGPVARLVICTGNPGKVDELTALLPKRYRLLSLTDLELPTDLPENGDTLLENALEKARFCYRRCGLPCIADDTGLEVDALNGAPGVYSARYAGPLRDAIENMRKLLEAMEGIHERSARFRTVIAMVDSDGERTFEGVVEGRITEGPRGSEGFGYDPIFLPLDSNLTFAEMDSAAKNRISHRGRAVGKLVAFLKSPTSGG